MFGGKALGWMARTLIWMRAPGKRKRCTLNGRHQVPLHIRTWGQINTRDV